MKFRNSYDPHLYSVKEAVMKLTEASFDNYGTVEQLQEKLKETRETMAKLVELLANNNMISGPEIAALVHMTLVLDE